ncbi:hypothetical protein WJX75_004419 [Coccomyxa subellipsoidea]|uniref:Ribosome biogenesis protein NOP53 n=1 Tax=Coccomyxa subellipsoidea TaxID=248742 RepID=A0ABR2YRK4_9CHLO
MPSRPLKKELMGSQRRQSNPACNGDEGVFSLPAVLQRPKRKKLPDPEPSHATKLRRQALYKSEFALLPSLN